MCLLGENFQYGLLGEKGCNFIMILSSGEPQPIFSNVAFGPSALRQHWKILASAHHLIMLHCICFACKFVHHLHDEDDYDDDDDDDDAVSKGEFFVWGHCV